MKYEYNVIVQENLKNGAIHMHTFYLDPDFVMEAVRAQESHNNPACMFVVAYCLN